jgi:site-specific DNA recombinase
MEQDLQPDNIEMHPNIGQLYQRKVSKISQLLTDQACREEAISLIRSLIERIHITPGEKRGQPQVQLVGGLAAILEFAVAKQQKTAIPSDSGFGRAFMVAGAGFEPATFRL